MNESLFPDNSQEKQPWSSEAMVGQEAGQQGNLLQWWYSFTTPPRPSTNANFVRREADRKARLLSSVAFFFLATLILFIPGALFMPLGILLVVFGAIFGTIIALIINRMGKTTFAGFVVALAAEAALTIGIQVMTPMDAASIQLYDLYTIIELLVVSLLPARYVFVAAFLNSLYIGIDLALLHPRTPGLNEALQTQLIPALVRPIGLQLMVAGVAFIWVSNATRAIIRANRAEMLATLEHTVAEQRAAIEREKLELEESIQQLVKAHVDAANGQIVTRIPYPPAKALWPLVGVINSLWVRLHHSQQIDHELQQLKQAIAAYNDRVQRAVASSQQSLPMVRTGTDLDALMLAIRTMYGGTPQNRGRSGERKM